MGSRLGLQWKAPLLRHNEQGLIQATAKKTKGNFFPHLPHIWFLRVAPFFLNSPRKYHFLHGKNVDKKTLTV